MNNKSLKAASLFSGKSVNPLKYRNNTNNFINLFSFINTRELFGTLLSRQKINYHANLELH